MGNPKLFVTFSLLMLLLPMWPMLIKPVNGSTDDNSLWTSVWHDPRVYGNASSDLLTCKSTTVTLLDPSNNLVDNIALVVYIESYGFRTKLGLSLDCVNLGIALYFESNGTAPYYYPDYAPAVHFYIDKNSNDQDNGNQLTSIDTSTTIPYTQGYDLWQDGSVGALPSDNDSRCAWALRALGFAVGLFCQPIGVATSLISLASALFPPSVGYQDAGLSDNESWYAWSVRPDYQPLPGSAYVRQYCLDTVDWCQSYAVNPVQSYSVNVSATVNLQQSTSARPSPFGGYVNMPPITLTIEHNQNQTLSISTSGGNQQCATTPSSGTYSFLYGNSTTVFAYVNGPSSYYFGCWMLNGVFAGYSPTIALTMTASYTLTAYFEHGGGGGGGGCPYVSVWNGSGYTLDNNILPSSEFSGGSDVKDYYGLMQPLVPVFQCTMTSLYSLRISEFEHEHDYIDQAMLLAVDHAADVNVGVSPLGEILTYKNPAPPVSAVSNGGASVLPLLNASGSSYYQSYNGSSVTLTFAPADVSAGAKLVIREDYLGNYKDPIYFQVLNSTGQWNTVTILVTRNNWATDVINMTGYLPDAQGSLTVRLYFTSTSRIDYVGLDTTPQANVQVHQAWLVGAVSSSQGDVTRPLSADDGRYAELLPGQQILLTFMLPTNQTQRTFILYTKGHYYTIP